MSRLPVMRTRMISLLVLASLTAFLSLEIPAHAQLPRESANPMLAEPRDRITSYVDDERIVTLHGNRHPLAIPQYDAGAVSPEYRMDRMVLTLLPDDSQQEALVQLLEGQHDPESPYYHQWLTPEQFGARFGLSSSDLAKVSAWLTSQGFTITKSALTLRASVPGLDEATFKQMAADAEKNCPVSKVLNAEITLDAALV